jgi:hypothetical protein
MAHRYRNRTNYLFSLEVTPYHPNRQLSIINSHGGIPRHHFRVNGGGVLVILIAFDDVYDLQYQYPWIKRVHRGYYQVRDELHS